MTFKTLIRNIEEREKERGIQFEFSRWGRNDCYTVYPYSRRSRKEKVFFKDRRHFENYSILLRAFINLTSSRGCSLFHPPFRIILSLNLEISYRIFRTDDSTIRKCLECRIFENDSFPFGVIWLNLIANEGSFADSPPAHGLSPTVITLYGFRRLA